MSSNAELERAIGARAPFIAGVLNVTPDSFSDGGTSFDPSAAIRRGEQLIRDGAHLLDIGGEATGPGSKPVSAADELARIESVVRALARQAFISIDTFKAETADRCLRTGAKMINDISGLRADGELPGVVAAHNAFLVIMYSKQCGASPHVDSSERTYTNIVEEIAAFLLQQSELAVAAGVKKERILLDPGMGRYLSNNPDDSWELLSRLDELVRLVSPFSVFIGTSRKGFLGGRLAERDPISQLSAVFAVQKGVSIIRTHNPSMAREFFAALERLGKLS